MKFILLTINGTTSALFHMAFLFMMVQAAMGHAVTKEVFYIFWAALVVYTVTPNKSELTTYLEMWK